MAVIILKEHLHEHRTYSFDWSCKNRWKQTAKNIGLRYRLSQFLNENSLKTVYFSYIHFYLYYANIAWASTYATKLKRVYLKQKHAVRIVFNKDLLIHSNNLFENLNALNIYRKNIYQHLNFMRKFINNQIPSIFSCFRKRADHKYPTNFLQSSFLLKKVFFEYCKIFYFYPWP